MRSTTPDPLLAQLGSHRWLVPLLADLAAHKGARFVELIHRLGLSRDSLTRTLEAAQATGWVQRNPGHGHPLRPEYILTEAGAAAATRAATIADAQQAIGLPPGAATRWGLPLVAGIGAGHDRFNALARLLVPATPRALSQGLTALGKHGLVTREIVDMRPPASRYDLTGSGRLLAEACL
ncbi:MULTISPECIES: winged helix-turn-helix transcriptional regulator [unclassified Sphingopyxis]|jgi:DNA-binding HxlR family transcriptional regulator|uniref:winged helix-turn-helix transcriptional regulator n=1 Tax=unclassified Sphingopyxis TaxID=2614943 RepID=UPI0007817534|nr:MULTISPECIES: winged helix-turn-helix transcriptional regulator [unclassified Sphingopyxis]USI77088.1 winged helix-turn-helix transcriptional regulator [Sphingopyxis sp. USTB-05]